LRLSREEVGGQHIVGVVDARGYVKDVLNGPIVILVGDDEFMGEL